MAYKTILVHCDVSRGTAGRLRIAADLADRFGGHVIGLYVRRAFQAPAFTDAGPAMDSLYRTYETTVRAEEAMATAAFRDAVGNKGLSSEWRVADGYVDEILAAEARVALLRSTLIRLKVAPQITARSTTVMKGNRTYGSVNRVIHARVPVVGGTARARRRAVSSEGILIVPVIGFFVRSSAAQMIGRASVLAGAHRSHFQHDHGMRFEPGLVRAPLADTEGHRARRRA